LNQSIYNEWKFNWIKVIENKRIFIVSRWSNNKKIYPSNNYKYIEIMKNTYNEYIIEFNILNNDLIVSYGGNL